MLKHLNEVNSVKIYSVFSDDFAPYGRVIEGQDFDLFANYLKVNTDIPESGNIYIASVKQMELFPQCRDIQNSIFGGMDIQVGYCNGRNSTYNGFEYHKSSEINLAVTDFMLVLGHVWQIKDNEFHIGQEKVFYLPEGTTVEIYGTTLHLSPCKVKDEGFKCLVILPKGTNTALTEKCDSSDPESKLLLQKGKWVLSHPERKALMDQGAYPGFIGENHELKY